MVPLIMSALMPPLPPPSPPSPPNDANGFALFPLVFVFPEFPWMFRCKFTVQWMGHATYRSIWGRLIGIVSSTTPWVRKCFCILTSSLIARWRIISLFIVWLKVIFSYAYKRKPSESYMWHHLSDFIWRIRYLILVWSGCSIHHWFLNISEHSF